jgi:magnesium transporter
MKGGAASRQRRFEGLLRSIGREREITSLARESAYSLGRLLTFLTHAANERKEDGLLKSRIRTAARDVQSLTDHVSFLLGKIVFLLDATLGMVNIQQNDIIKIVSHGAFCPAARSGHLLAPAPCPLLALCRPLR